LSTAALELRIRKLERRIYGLLAIGGLLAVGVGMRVDAAGNAQILHARGLVIEDDQGRPRILLGAPFPRVAQRKRQDETTTAMIFLDEKGADRFLVGDRIKIPQIRGKVPTNFNSGAARGLESYGAYIFDAVGNERGGYAYNSNGSAPGRAIISLDRLAGDAWGVAVDDKDDAAFQLMNYAPQNAVGSSPTAWNLQTSQDEATMEWYDRAGKTRASLSMARDGNASLNVSDANGLNTRNLFSSNR
jgi:hypothetical protein